MPRSRFSVLLVDDDLLLCRSISRALRVKGLDVHSVQSAADTLRHLEDNHVDIILLDWVLPDRDGVALLQHLRERGVATPVIMLTGVDSTEARVRALNRGADDFIVKPANIDELAARIHAHVRRASGVLALSRAGRISIDVWKQEASVDGKRIDLTPIEHAILTHLVRHVGRVVPRKELVEAAWAGKGGEGSSKALDVQFTRLRRKLGSAADQIEVVRGTGVRLHGKKDLDGRDRR